MKVSIKVVTRLHQILEKPLYILIISYILL